MFFFSPSQVLQKQMDLELELFGDLKDISSSSAAAAASLSSSAAAASAASNARADGGGGGKSDGNLSSGGGGGASTAASVSNNNKAPVGKIFMLSLSSQPVDHEDHAGRTKVQQTNEKESQI